MTQEKYKNMPTPTPKTQKKKVTAFIVKNNLAVLSTLNDKGVLDAAPVYIVVEPNLVLYFVTPKGTQKYKNLIKNPDVVLTFVQEEDQETVQIRARASEASGEELQDALVQLSNILGERFPEQVAHLPLLHYTGQEKVAIKLVPYEVHYRMFKGRQKKEIVLGKKELAPEAR